MTTQTAHRAAPRPTSLNPARRFSVRLTLATGATLATLLGSQTLSILETPSAISAAGNAVTVAADGRSDNASSATTVQVLALPTSVGPKAPAAPLLVIARNPGGPSSVIASQKGSASQTTRQNAVMQAPSQSTFTAPAPVFVSPSFTQPMPFTRSSR